MKRTEITEKVRFPRGQGYLFTRAGSPHWYSALWIAGRGEIIASTGTADVKTARRWHKHQLDLKGADAAGLADYVAPKIRRLTCGQCLDALAQDYETRQIKSIPTIWSHFVPVRTFFGHRPVLTVTEQLVGTYIARRREAGKANATINKETAVLGQALRLKVDGVRLPNPPTMPHLTERNARAGFLSPDDVAKLLAQLPEDLRDVTHFAWRTAWRRGEIVGLRWAWVDRAESIIRLPDSKNGTGRTLVLDEDLIQLVTRRWEQRSVPQPDGSVALSPLVFHRFGGRPVADFYKSWATACEKAGIGPRLFHDLRRSGVRNMIRAGVHQHVAMKISGHRSAAVFARYNITSSDDLRDAMTRTGAYTTQATGGGTTATVTPLPTRTGEGKKAATR